MGPEKELPLPNTFTNVDQYVDALLEFGTTSQLLQTLCGGVHILDFFVRTPDLYAVVIPEDWRTWFRNHQITDILDLLLREDITQLEVKEPQTRSDMPIKHQKSHWRDGPLPPSTLIQYISAIRGLCLDRSFNPLPVLKHSHPHQLAGMKPKKVHEVDHFGRYVCRLTDSILAEKNREITHLVDFGSGQNYLGRALASQPRGKNIIAIESRPHVVDGARNLDIRAKLVEKEKVMRNKKLRREQLLQNEIGNTYSIPPQSSSQNYQFDHGNSKEQDPEKPLTVKKSSSPGNGSIQYIQKRIEDGDLSEAIEQLNHNSQKESPSKSNGKTCSDPALMVISLHSCGNLLHHGLRTLSLNPTVQAVAMIGCCYNLMSERLGPPTHKIPVLRFNHPRLQESASSRDPHGFPMSNRLLQHKHEAVCTSDRLDDTINTSAEEVGIRLNITARMMAVQAPSNWTDSDSANFFTRHFYRALLQRIFLDHGLVEAPEKSHTAGGRTTTSGSGGAVGGSVPIIVGNLSKRCYESFVTYVRGAASKVSANGDELGLKVQGVVAALSDDEIRNYERSYQDRKKDLSIVWSLMAFSAQILEAIIVVDRWLWLKEQDCVEKAWVEPVFDYTQSPRNLVVVGVKR